MDSDMVRALARKKGYAFIETHISWVLVGKEFAYKIKKPVKFSFLDFSTLARRRFFCNEEVRLNKRLAPEIYLGVVQICQLAGEDLEIEEIPPGASSGSTCDYAVKMRRLEDSDRMDILLSKGKVRKESVIELAQKVALFHEKAERARDDYGAPEMVAAQVEDLGNFRETVQSACGMGAAIEFVLGRSKVFMEKHEKLFKERMDRGFIRDCHGDLHSRNIFIENGLVITDCIEFNRDFRCIDVASDVAFMGMDLDYSGREDLSKAFIDSYVSRCNECGIETLIPFYKCYRANVRAKVAAIEWTQGRNDESRLRMKGYLSLAEKYAAMW